MRGYHVAQRQTPSLVWSGSNARQGRSHLLSARAWWLYLVVLAPVAGLYLVGPRVFNAGPVFNVIGLSAVGAILVGVYVHRPRVRWAWYLFAAGQTLFVGGDVLAYNYERLFGRALPFPSVADALYIAVYPAITAGLILLIRRRNRRADAASLIDSLIVATAAGLLSWVFLIAPYTHDSTLSLSARLTSIAYPLMDLLILSAALRLAFGSGHRGRAYTMIVASICVLFATDGVYGWLQLHGGYTTGGLLDGGWILFYALFGAAALHPSMALVEEQAAPGNLTRSRLVLLTAATFIAPLAGLFGATKTSDRIVIACGAIALFGLVLVRMVGLMQTQESAAAREVALRQTTDRLLELDRLKDQFVATVSHELRTPLTSIQGYLEMMLDGETGELDDEQRAFIGIAGRNSDRLRRLVDDLLLVSELDAGGLAFTFGDIDLRAVLRESVESAQPGAEAGGIDLELAPGAPIPLVGDAFRLTQMVDNVISNALKFTPRGGHVSVRAADTSGGAVLEVQDTGIGISADEQRHVFDRFFRARAADEGAVQGTGLGLAITKAIVAAHGASCEIVSREGFGTTFRVVFGEAA
jgi:signal transduction histidine kinase